MEYEIRLISIILFTIYDWGCLSTNVYCLTSSGLPTEQEVTLAVAIKPGVLAIDRGLGADLIEAMEKYPNYEQWMAANKQSSNIQLIEERTPLTKQRKQTNLSPRSAKRKSYQEWAAKWKRERVLNMSAASRLVTKTDMEPHCRPEYKRPLNRPR